MKGTIEFQRLKAVMTSDLANKPARFEEVLRAELFGVLKNYFECSAEDIRIRVDAEGRGVKFVVEGSAKAVRPFLSLPL